MPGLGRDRRTGGVEVETARKLNLVGRTADRLRDIAFAADDGALIGSLQDLTAALTVGVVTLQQAARVLEHEGLLEIRRGPGGGYYATRPDAAALARSIGVYLRSHPSSFEEALDITSLLFSELVAAAAGCTDDALRGEMEGLLRRIDDCITGSDSGAHESDLLDLLFRMVDWPLFKMLMLVTLRVAETKRERLLPDNAEAMIAWRSGRGRIIAAILERDGELARFEADRCNRRPILNQMRARRDATIRCPR